MTAPQLSRWRHNQRRFCSLQQLSRAAAALPADPQQHLGREQQHHRVPRPHRPSVPAHQGEDEAVVLLVQVFTMFVRDHRIISTFSILWKADVFFNVVFYQTNMISCR